MSCPDNEDNACGKPIEIDSVLVGRTQGSSGGVDALVDVGTLVELGAFVC